MSSSVAFIPARKNHIRKLIEQSQLVKSQEDIICECFKNDKVYNKLGNYSENNISNAIRISQILASNQGGRISFGNQGNSLPLNYLGTIEGMPGGIPRLPRNKF